MKKNHIKVFYNRQCLKSVWDVESVNFPLNFQIFEQKPLHKTMSNNYGFHWPNKHTGVV